MEWLAHRWTKKQQALLTKPPQNNAAILSSALLFLNLTWGWVWVPATRSKISTPTQRFLDKAYETTSRSSDCEQGGSVAEWKGCFPHGGILNSLRVFVFRSSADSHVSISSLGGEVVTRPSVPANQSTKSIWAKTFIMLSPAHKCQNMCMYRHEHTTFHFLKRWWALKFLLIQNKSVWLKFQQPWRKWF